MAEVIFWIKVIVLTALVMVTYTQDQPKRFVSPLTENSFQDHSVCISYLNSTLGRFLQKLNRPVNASSGVLRIGKDIEEILNKKLTNVMLKCRSYPAGTSLPLRVNLTLLKLSGKSFYVEQTGIRKFDFKPRLKPEVVHIMKADSLTASLNYVAAKKIKQKTLHKQQVDRIRDYAEEIRLLELAIDQMETILMHEINSHKSYHNKIKIAQSGAADANNNYNSLKAEYDEITENYCDCELCEPGEQPTFAEFSGRSMFEKTENFTEVSTLSP